MNILANPSLNSRQRQRPNVLDASIVKLLLKDMYNRMSRFYGPTHWWPGDSPFEIAVGAILTQNTAWTNVEKAIANLKQEKLLHPERMTAAPRAKLENALRPSGYFRQKAERLCLFCQFLLTHHHGSMKRLSALPLETLRSALLALKGIGPETADDIMLYACEKPVFVVDAYTRRILSRHGLVKDTVSYDAMQQIFHQCVKRDVAIYKEFHGLIVWTGKDFCRRKPDCTACPLRLWAGNRLMAQTC